MAQVLQRRRNHDTFELVRVSVESRPDLAERFKIATVPTLVLVKGKRSVARIEGRASAPRIEQMLAAHLGADAAAAAV